MEENKNTHMKEWTNGQTSNRRRRKIWNKQTNPADIQMLHDRINKHLHIWNKQEKTEQNEWKKREEIMMIIISYIRLNKWALFVVEICTEITFNQEIRMWKKEARERESQSAEQVDRETATPNIATVAVKPVIFEHTHTHTLTKMIEDYYYLYCWI